MLVSRKHDSVDNLTVWITQQAMRYCVRLRDNDSGNFLPHARVYSTHADAITYANDILRRGEWYFPA